MSPSTKTTHTFSPNDIVQHFKRDFVAREELADEPNLYLYKIIGEAHHTETDEPLMLYQALYGEQKLCARPLEIFLSEVDRKKYPQAKQRYRFELKKP